MARAVLRELIESLQNGFGQKSGLRGLRVLVMGIHDRAVLLQHELGCRHVVKIVFVQAVVVLVKRLLPLADAGFIGRRRSAPFQFTWCA